MATKALLLAFEQASGLKINYHKSSIICMKHGESGATTSNILMRCNKESLPSTYLGLPLITKSCQNDAECHQLRSSVGDSSLGKISTQGSTQVRDDFNIQTLARFSKALSSITSSQGA